MKTTVVGWSAVLLALAGVLCFFPVPGPWLSPVFALFAWVLVVLRGRTTPVARELVTEETVAPLVATPAPVEYRETVPVGLLNELQEFRGSLELLGGLKGLVVKDTEDAVVRLTQALFTLVENSKAVSTHIEQSLSFITDGEKGLGRTVENLEQQVQVFESLADHFEQVKAGLSTDISALTKAVGSINQFSGTLSDLADQTNVLAINASIEAARVGIHGRGFAVIATHVQTLAKNSKEISDKMARTVREVVGNVESSFARQTQRIEESEVLILRSEKDLRSWSEHVGPQVAEVQAMIGDSRRLAGVVTAELGDVTVSLQFQDRIRQILDHMAEILEENALRLVGAAALPSGPVPAASRDAAFEAASKHFTIREEWALGSGKSSTANAKTVELF